MEHKILNTLFILTFFIFISCQDKIEYPSFSITEVENITFNSAIVNWEVTDFGTFGNGSGKGICYNETGNPEVNDVALTEFHSKSSLRKVNQSAIIKLKPNITYFVRAFIQNNTNTDVIYSNEFEFKTPDVEIYIDSRDSQPYPVIQIGSQKWFAKNLNYQTETGSYAPQFGVGNINYGRLYNYETAKDVCPTGWHLPNDEEWKVMELNLGLSQEEADKYFIRGVNIGIKIKEPGRLDWKGNVFSNNETGFTALPSGVYKYNTITGANENILSNNCFFQSATIDSATSGVIIRYLESWENGIGRRFGSQEDGYSVRCVSDVIY